MNKRAALLLVTVLTFSSLTMGESAFAQSILTPSVPHFTVKLVANPYDVPPTTSTTIDQYTGKEIVTTTPGYHVENKSIEITIENQPFTAYTNAEGHIINLFYNIRFKGHFGQDKDWKELYPYEPIRNGEYGTYHPNPPQSNSEYTAISFPAEFPSDAIVDFQAQAMEGYYTQWAPILVGPLAWQFTGESSSWSNIETVDFSANASSSSSSSLLTQNSTISPPTSTPNQTTEPTPSQTTEATVDDASQTLLLGIVIGTVIASVVVTAVTLVSFKKRKQFEGGK